MSTASAPSVHNRRPIINTLPHRPHQPSGLVPLQASFFDENLKWHEKGEMYQPIEFPTMHKRRITPEFALELLTTRNPINRTIEKRRVKEYVEAIRQGKWVLSDVPISINTDGFLTNGQHRLTAIFDSETAVDLWMYFGIPEKAIYLHDGHRPRSLLDTARLVGVETNRLRLSATNFILETALTTKRVGNEDRLAFQERHAEAASFVCDKLTERGFQIAPIAAACIRAYYHFKRQEGGLERLSQFIESLQSGVYDGQAENIAPITLARFILRVRSFNGTARKDQYRKSIAALAAYLNRQSIDKLYGRDPEIMLLPEEENGPKSPLI